MNLSPYHIFMKTTADESEDAFSSIPVPLDVDTSEETAEKVIAASRRQYATPLKKVGAQLSTGSAINRGSESYAIQKIALRPLNESAAGC